MYKKHRKTCLAMLFCLKHYLQQPVNSNWILPVMRTGSARIFTLKWSRPVRHSL